LALGSTVLVALAALLGRWTASVWRRTLWRAAFACLAILLIAEATGTANFLAFHIFPTHFQEKSLSRAETPSDSPLPRNGGEGLGVRGRDEPGNALLTSEPEALDPDLPSASGVWWPGVLWLAGTLAVILRSLLGRGLLLLFRRRHTATDDAALNERVRAVAARLRFRRHVTVLQAPGLCGPVAFGIWRPTIAVPADFTTHFDAPKQEVMLAHELAHLAARDPAWLLSADMVAALLWWQPLIWWARRQLAAAGETAADEASLLVADGPGLLAACLVELGTRLATPGKAGWVRMAGTGFRSSLGRRVERLLRMRDQSWHPAGGVRSRLVLILASTVLLTCAVLSTAWARPQVSEEGDESMPTVQRSWRHSLAGAFLLAALAPATDAVPGESPPKPPEKSTSESKPLPELERETQKVQAAISSLNVRRNDLRQKLKEGSPTLKDIEAKIAELEALKRELEIKQQAMSTKQIRVFRLKHVKAEEVRQALESLLGGLSGAAMSSGAMMMGMGGPGNGTAPRMMGSGGGMMPPGGGMAGMASGMMGPRAGAGSAPDWRLTFDERTQSIVMRGSRLDLQRAADLIAVLDLPGGKPIPKVKNLRAFKLQFARADKIAEILDQLGTEARILPLAQTNRLIVAGPDAAIKEVAELIEELDVEK
jgi:beta-lactamase regulating signal transducer with metallopeptidase domain